MAKHDEANLIDSKSIRKVLALEASRGYDNSAVIGGLDRFVKNWATKVAQFIADRRILSDFEHIFYKTYYHDLDSTERKKWIERATQFLDSTESSSTPKPQNIIVDQKHRPVTKSRYKQRQTHNMIDSPICAIKGVSTNLTAKFSKLGISTIRDLLYFFPHRHMDYSKLLNISNLETGIDQTIIANVWQTRIITPGGHRSTEAIVGDETGNVRAVWFNNPYLTKQIKTNNRIVISGKVNLYKGRQVFESPEWEILDESEGLIHTGRLVPIYPLTKGLRSRQIRKLMKEVVELYSHRLDDFLPPSIIKTTQVLDLPQALYQAHFPDNTNIKDEARRRLAFDELFLLQLGVLAKKREWQESQPSYPIKTDKIILDRFIKSLPFKLTGAQKRSLDEILHDITRVKAMSRLLQGEVGSGKTVIATTSLIMAAVSGFQSAFMAPTEILAEQHFRTVSKLLEGIGTKVRSKNSHVITYKGTLKKQIRIALLISDIKPSIKKTLYKAITEGEIDILIGTHALIQKDVRFKNLSLAVIDEQHRFGVAQRSILRQKGANPHVLVMTATPIPRTLALTLYGDLDLSVIDELPLGRSLIKTKWLTPEQRNSGYAFINKQISSKRQAFIICPLVEESEVIQAKAATKEFERLQKEVFPDRNLGLIHGRLPSEEKEKIMRSFRSGKIDILVATPVIEVGIDIPNATVMLVESAERFGLSQLHQFRGRIGRGKYQGYCMFLSENASEVGIKRLDIIENTHNGFQLAEEDLKLRGPGEFFGTRQSGLPELKMARLSDVVILELARREATLLFQKDPKLKEFPLLVKELSRVWPQNGEWS
jgi:ATP-dependent DNA helicase RecG